MNWEDYEKYRLRAFGYFYSTFPKMKRYEMEEMASDVALSLVEKPGNLRHRAIDRLRRDKGRTDRRPGWVEEYGMTRRRWAERLFYNDEQPSSMEERIDAGKALTLVDAWCIMGGTKTQIAEELGVRPERVSRLLQNYPRNRARLEEAVLSLSAEGTSNEEMR